VADDDGPGNTQRLPGLDDQRRLPLGRPQRGSRPIAISEAGPVKGDDPVSFRHQRKDAARFPILHHRAIAVQQDQRAALPSLDIMEANAVDLDEAAFGRVGRLRALGAGAVEQGGTCQRNDGADRGERAAVAPCGRGHSVDGGWLLCGRRAVRRCVVLLLFHARPTDARCNKLLRAQPTASRAQIGR